MLSKKKAESEAPPNLAEMLSLMSFYRAMQPSTHTLDLLKYAGFRIKGLQGTKGPNIESRRHALAWNETLKVGICLCGWKGTEGWEEKMTTIQYDMHVRRNKDGKPKLETTRT